MRLYKAPNIEILAFDEEEVLTDSTNNGYTAANAVTAMMGDDADVSGSKNVDLNITTVKVTSLN